MGLRRLLGLKSDVANIHWWGSARERLSRHIVVIPHSKPSFELTPPQTIFTMGSCFARNIEENLDQVGFDVPALRFVLPKEEWRGKVIRNFTNKYTPPTIRQDMEWAAAIYRRDGRVKWEDCAPFAFQAGDKYVDLQVGGYVAVAKERLLARRQELFDIYASAFRADCVVITAGLIEAWRDAVTGLYIHSVPREDLPRVDRFQFQVLSYEQSLDEISRAIQIIREFNPKCNGIITTSPIALERTFTGQDIITANLYSKSVLRAVTGEIAAAFERFDYFPSYEAAMLSSSKIWEKDHRHVNAAFVKAIVDELLNRYSPTASMNASGGERRLERAEQVPKR